MHEKANILMIINSPFFDKEFYISELNRCNIPYRKIFVSKFYLVKHYLTIGWKIGINPSIKFDSKLYLELYPDVKGNNPLLHYLKFGIYEARDIFSVGVLPIEKISDYKLLIDSELFDIYWYKNEYKKNNLLRTEIISDYILNEQSFNNNPSEKFDSKLYLELYPDVKGNNPLLHYLKFGIHEARDIFFINELSFSQLEDYKIVKKSGFFDLRWYKKIYNCSDNGKNCLAEYLIDRNLFSNNPSIKFNTMFYLNAYPDVLNSGMHPLIHYLKYGISEHRTIECLTENFSIDYNIIKNSSHFDYLFYSLFYHDLVGDSDPVQHYLTIGWKNSCNPSIYFDNDTYLTFYNLSENPLLFYEKKGKLSDNVVGVSFVTENFFSFVLNNNLFNVQFYSNQLKHQNIDNFNITCDFEKLLIHYVIFGWKNNLDPSLNFSTSLWKNFFFKNQQDTFCPLLKIYCDSRNYKIKNLPYLISSSFPEVLRDFRFSRFFKKYQATRSIKKNKSYKILLISHDLSISGAPISLIENAEILRELGFNVFVIGLSSGELEGILKQKGFDYCLTNDIQMIINFALMSDLAICNTIVLYDIVNTLREIVPTIWWIREDPDDFLTHNSFLIDVLCANTDIYVMSEYSRKQYLNYNSSIKVIKHGITDCSNFVKSRNCSYLQNGILNLACIGSIEERKGQDLLVQSTLLLMDKFHDLNIDVRIYLIGRILDDEFLHSFTVSFNESDDFLSIQNDFTISKLFIKERVKLFLIEPINERKKLYSIIRTMDYVVVPSRREPTSRVAIEAAMLSVPAIMSDRVGAQYLIDSSDYENLVFSNLDDLIRILSELLTYTDEQYNSLSLRFRNQYEKCNSIDVLKTNLLTMVSDAINSYA